MSRLDSFIRRMQAQRACLDQATTLIADVPGVILELGLGNGRTYDHLREIFPGRRIFVFEREVRAHPDCIPKDEDLFIGDFRQTLPMAPQRIGVKVALAHADFGGGDPERVAATARFLAEFLPALMAVGGVVASDQLIPVQGWEALPLPDGVEAGRYHLRRVT
jgi:hypothetical protein